LHRVLVLTTAFPTPRQPVVGTFVREHARAAALQQDVAVVHLDGARFGDFGLHLEKSEAPPVWRLRYRRLPPPLSYVSIALGLLRVVARFGRPDVVHAHSLFAAIPALLLGAALRRPVVYTEYWSVFLPEDPNTLRPALARAARFALNRSTIVLPVSAALESQLRRIAPQASYHVVRNVVDAEVFAPRDAKPRRTTIGLVSVGLMDDDSKGFDLLLKAFAGSEQALRLDIVGDGAHRSRYEQLAHDLGVADRVSFRGIVDKATVADLMREADVFVLASRFENNPVVLLEALSSGLPVVATAVGGVPEVVTDERGVLVAPNDPDALAAGIDAIVTRLATFDGKELAARAHESFSLETIGSELGTIYDEVAGSRAKRRAGRR
jgi:glycosyltransferase involved in cell wall biosynthesis